MRRYEEGRTLYAAMLSEVNVRYKFEYTAYTEEVSRRGPLVSQRGVRMELRDYKFHLNHPSIDDDRFFVPRYDRCSQTDSVLPTSVSSDRVSRVDARGTVCHAGYLEVFIVPPYYRRRAINTRDDFSLLRAHGRNKVSRRANSERIRFRRPKNSIAVRSRGSRRIDRVDPSKFGAAFVPIDLM